jgi:hypothetical protein
MNEKIIATVSFFIGATCRESYSIATFYVVAVAKGLVSKM